MIRNVKLKNVIRKQLLIEVITSNWNTICQQVSSNDSAVSNYIFICKSTKYYKIVQCLMLLTTVRENNIQQMIHKCCMLLGKKSRSFDRGLSQN